uniref:DPBB_1 domain-containing protein n=1 Tax=Steinernema glaseri TaxID=37863 RepID=A0A1I8ADZ1_9BILA
MYRLLALLFTFSPLGLSLVLFNVPQSGDITFYDPDGTGACGIPFDLSSPDLVSVSYQWFDPILYPNSNDDPVCNHVCVKVDYQGKSITVPVRDKCSNCDWYHLDLSRTAFDKLASEDAGHVYGVTWSFVQCGSSLN